MRGAGRVRGIRSAGGLLCFAWGRGRGRRARREQRALEDLLHVALDLSQRELDRRPEVCTGARRQEAPSVLQRRASQRCKRRRKGASETARR